ncbi:TIGR02450 family Trp-rich protein [Colwellia sp. D2M02]|uniref:TIGR02450 family Trp-rich protein n=1 Tax=Colwellia asteriadis TaxID=517723 RepID=A0ABN1LB84_9GAMM|nr:TIGR02450 family Trp-rich protein [Colwellia sp. D2M02]MBU2892776.1 TIGR02450 family Trp-rich protein [Colwellia sp. D2M02]
MNKVSPKSLLNSKWTKVEVINKEKHFIITAVEFDEEQRVSECIIEAVINNNEYSINWRDLKNPQLWKIGWQ